MHLVMLENFTGWEFKEGPLSGALVTKFLSYAVKKNLRT